MPARVHPRKRLGRRRTAPDPLANSSRPKCENDVTSRGRREQSLDRRRWAVGRSQRVSASLGRSASALSLRSAHCALLSAAPERRCAGRLPPKPPAPAAPPRRQWAPHGVRRTSGRESPAAFPAGSSEESGPRGETPNGRSRSEVPKSDCPAQPRASLLLLTSYAREHSLEHRFRSGGNSPCRRWREYPHLRRAPNRLHQSVPNSFETASSAPTSWDERSA